MTDQRDPGAPLELYRLLQPAGEPELIHENVPPAAAILELGCGTGRITHPLLALGHAVVAVDFDTRMLEHIRGAETVHSSIEELDLGRTFPVVLLMSTLINHPDAARRAALLASCRRHVATGGVVLIERLDPSAGLDTTPTERRHAGVLIRVSDISRDGQLLDQTIDYDAGDRGKWRVRREGARLLSDDEMRADLEAAGLRLDRWLDPARRWLMASPRP